MADDLADSDAGGDLEAVTLTAEFRLETPPITELNDWHLIWSRLDEMEYTLNGVPITPRPIVKDRLTNDAPGAFEMNKNWSRWVTFDLTAGPLPHPGRNEFRVRVVTPDEQLTGPRDLMLGQAEIHVEYAEHTR